MSFDFQLGHACPHLTIEEEVPLGADRQELRTRQPVASSSRIRITANDEVSIPSQGLLSRAQLLGAGSGPFRIVKTENEITIANRTQTLSDFALPVGTRVETTRVVELLNAAFRTQSINILAENDDGYVVLTDLLDQGSGSQVRVSGPAALSIGFTQQIRARGRTVYPGWGFAERDVVQVIPGLSSVRQVPTRYPKFNSPVKGNPVFKVTYTTYQAHCRRCQGFGIENDWRIGPSGEPSSVVNEDLLNQDVLKVLSTIKGSNPFHKEYGTLLLTRIGSKAIGGAAASVNEDVITALAVFQRLQTFAGKYQEITPRQRLASVISINTTPSEFDPTVFEVTIVAANAANVPVVITTVYAAPGTAALAGSNGLSLGLEGFGLNPATRALPGVAAG
jgi:phage baseplate assembly protein W